MIDQYFPMQSETEDVGCELVDALWLTGPSRSKTLL